MESAGRPMGLGLRSLWLAFALPSRMSVSRPRGPPYLPGKKKKTNLLFFLCAWCFLAALPAYCSIWQKTRRLLSASCKNKKKPKRGGKMFFFFFPRPPSFPPSPPLFLLGGKRILWGEGGGSWQQPCFWFPAFFLLAPRARWVRKLPSLVACAAISSLRREKF